MPIKHSTTAQLMNLTLGEMFWRPNDSDIRLNDHTPELWTFPGQPLETLSPAGHMFIGVYLTLLGVLAMLGNGSVLIIMQLTTIFRRKSQNTLITSLAWSDLVLSLIGYPMTAASSFSQRWLFGDLVCQLHGFLIFMMSMGSMNTLVIIAVFRYVVICHPASEYRLTQGLVRKCLFCAWAHAFIWTGLPLVGWSSYTYEPFGTACSINWKGSSLADHSYVIATMFSCYVIQVSIITYCYVSTVHVVRRLTFGSIPVKRRSSSRSLFGTTSGSVAIGAKKEKKKKALPVPVVVPMSVNVALRMRKVRAERAVTMICLTMILAYFFIWTPYAAISLTSMFVKIPLWLTAVPTMFAKMACVANPIIYCLLSRRFRRICRSLRLTTKLTDSHQALSRSAAYRKGLHSLPEREFVTKDGIYIGKDRPLYIAESTIL